MSGIRPYFPVALPLILDAAKRTKAKRTTQVNTAWLAIDPRAILHISGLLYNTIDMQGGDEEVVVVVVELNWMVKVET